MAYDGLSVVYDRLMQDVDYDSWFNFIKQCFNVNSETSVLDTACGTGAISIKLASCGANVTGIDLSGEMLEVAAESARKNGLRINFAAMDMCNIKLHKTVDLVTCVCDGVNYLAGINKVRDYFTVVFNLLKKNGKFIFDISSEYKLIKILGNNFFFEDYDDLTYFWQNSIDDVNRCINMDLCFFIADGDKYERFDESHTQYIYSKDDIVGLLKSVGFEDCTCYDCYSNKSIQNDTERITFIATK